MYEVRYDDGADHQGVGTFENMLDATRFARVIRSCGYEAVVKDMSYSALLDTDWDDQSDIEQWSKTTILD